jgi:hypothetical protein
VHWRAVLVENKRVNGRPKQGHVAYVVGLTESALVSVSKVMKHERSDARAT